MGSYILAPQAVVSDYGRWREPISLRRLNLLGPDGISNERGVLGLSLVLGVFCLFGSVEPRRCP
jgi:hypothetical protein